MTKTKPISQAPVENKMFQENVSLEDYFINYVLHNQQYMSETQLAKNLGISRKSLWERRNKLSLKRQK